MKVFLVLGVLLFATPFAAAVDWKTYVNDRFGYSIEYPGHAKSNELGESDQGRIYMTPDEEYAQHVYAGFVGDKTLDDFYKDSLLFYENTNITYKVKRKEWFVVSGVNKGGGEYYYKVVTKGGRYASFLIRYPHSKNKTYDRYVERIAKSFKPFLAGNYPKAPRRQVHAVGGPLTSSVPFRLDATRLAPGFEGHDPFKIIAAVNSLSPDKSKLLDQSYRTALLGRLKSLTIDGGLKGSSLLAVEVNSITLPWKKVGTQRTSVLTRELGGSVVLQSEKANLSAKRKNYFIEHRIGVFPMNHKQFDTSGWLTFEQGPANPEEWKKNAAILAVFELANPYTDEIWEAPRQILDDTHVTHLKTIGVNLKAIVLYNKSTGEIVEVRKPRS